MTDSLILVDTSDPAVTVVTLDRPEKRNALSVALIERLTDAVLAAGNDTARRVLLVRGNGPVFCAGLDLSEAAEPANSARSAEALAKLYGVICRSPLVTIAAAHGAAIGGGAGLLAACDIVVAAEDLKVGFPEVRRGLVAALVTCLLRRHMGDRAVRELILLGRTVDAHTAAAVGMVNRVVPTRRVDEFAMDVGREACRGAPDAIARTKRLLDDLAMRPIEEDLRIALRYHLESRNSAESAEGIAAFHQKREPLWGAR